MRRNAQLITNNPGPMSVMIQDLATDFQNAAKVIMSVRIYGVAAKAIEHAVGLIS